MGYTLKVEDLPHYTYDDYAQWEGNWELIRGIPYAMSSPMIRHQEISFNIGMQLHRLLENSSTCKSLMAVDWEIVEDTVVRPDNIVICGNNPDEKKIVVPPVLVFEILSPSTSRRDKIIKYGIYENAGVKYYCIVDPENECVEVFNMIGERFRSMEVAEAGMLTFDLGSCVIAFDCNEIFKRNKIQLQ